MLSDNNYYVFDINEGTFTDRFELVFEKNLNSVSDINSVISVFPNPAKDKLYINFTGKSFNKYTLLDVTGRIMTKGKLCLSM